MRTTTAAMTTPRVLMRFRGDQMSPRMAAEHFAATQTEIVAAIVEKVSGQYMTPQQCGRRMEWLGWFAFLDESETYRLAYDGKEWTVSR